MTIALLGILIGLMANVAAAVGPLSLLGVPAGARIRPMFQVATPCAAVPIGLVGCSVGFISVREEGTRWAGGAGLILGLSPFPVGWAVLQYVQQIRQFHFLP